MNRHLVTGATGFVGAALVLDLLAGDPDCEVLCLVRGRGPDTAARRLSTVLRTAARLYDREDVAADPTDRVRCVHGDLLEPACGVQDVRDVTTVWHSAASLDYREARSDTIFRHNLAGTANVLELLDRLGRPFLNHVSTAYVAGARTGVILEEPARDPELANNAYERSKIAAEMLIARSGVTARILRPSIVIGHSETFAATGFTGVYSFVGDLRRLKHEVEQRLGSFLSHRAVRARARPDAEMNLVPVDVVARTAVALDAAVAPAGIYHLTNATPPSIDDVVRVVCQEVGVRPFELGAAPEEFTAIDERFDADDRMQFFRSYVVGQRSFDQTNVRAALGTPAAADLQAERWRAYVRWYLELLQGVGEDTSDKYRLFA